MLSTNALMLLKVFLRVALTIILVTVEREQANKFASNDIDSRSY